MPMFLATFLLVTLLCAASTTVSLAFIPFRAVCLQVCQSAFKPNQMAWQFILCQFICRHCLFCFILYCGVITSVQCKYWLLTIWHCTAKMEMKLEIKHAAGQVYGAWTRWLLKSLLNKCKVSSNGFQIEVIFNIWLRHLHKNGRDRER